MSGSLQVVALISGGKDSLFSLLHCLQNEHSVVALANLHPPARALHSGHDASTSTGLQAEEEEDDLNSFMYQTIGHQIIPSYADALGIPLYRRAISGSAVQTGRYYDASEQSLQHSDETEDLFQLLQHVLKIHPEVNAVSSGAILSTYQRTRVESVAVRLGLTPLAYLWQYPALPPPLGRLDSLTGLLDDMAVAGCDARIIKIASGGMKETLLWSNVTDNRTRSRLVAGMAPFHAGHESWLRGAVLGEGGEYETLAIDGPPCLWKKRLVFDANDIATVTGEGGVYHTRLGRVSVMEKDAETAQDDALVRIPQLLDGQFETVQARVGDPADDGGSLMKTTTAKHTTPFQLPNAAMTVSSAGITLSNVVAEDIGLDASSQMSQIVRQVEVFLSSIDPPITTSNAVSVLLLLSTMSDFATVNLLYASLYPLGEPNPPARVTVAATLPVGVRVSLSMIISRSPRSQLRGLHVQSRSYWAPANIGPYSQAVSEPLTAYTGTTDGHDALALEVAHVAGQIPLVPQSMEMLAGTFEEQVVLSLQHLWRIGQERGVNIWPWGITFLCSTDHTPMHAEAALKVWVHAHAVGASRSDSGHSSEEDEDQDIWFAQQNRSVTNSAGANTITCGQHLHVLPDHAVIDWSASVSAHCPPFLAAEVISLPRNAPIEWWSHGVANISSSSSKASFTSKSWPWGHVSCLMVAAGHIEDSQFRENVTFMSIFLVAGTTLDSLPSLGSIMDEIGLSVDSKARQLTSAHSTMFLSAQGILTSAEICDSLALDLSPAVIPCRQLWGSVFSADLRELFLQPIHAALFLRIESFSTRNVTSQLDDTGL